MFVILFPGSRDSDKGGCVFILGCILSSWASMCLEVGGFIVVLCLY